MKKQLISMLLTIAMLLSSVTAIPVFAAEPETYPDTLVFGFDDFDTVDTWSLLQNLDGYKANWTSGEGYYPNTLEGNPEVYPINGAAAHPKLNLNYTVNGGKYLLSFDYYLPGGDKTPRDFAVYAVDREDGTDAAEKVEMYISATGFNSVRNSTSWDHNKILIPERDRWYNIALLFDIDNNKVHYYIDNVLLDTQDSTITEIDQFWFHTSYASSENRLGYMDNVVAGYVLNANLTFPDEKVVPSSAISFNADYAVSEASLSTIKLLNSENAETEIVANLTNGGKTVNIVPVEALAGESIYTVDLSGLTTAYETPYIQKGFSVQTDKAYKFAKFDFNDYYWSGHTWGESINQYSSSWISPVNGASNIDGGQGEAYSDDGHRYVYKFANANTNLCYTGDHEITSGKYVYSFDWLSKSDSTTATDFCNVALTPFDDPNASGTNKIARFENGKAMFLNKNWNVTFNSANATAYQFGEAWDKWHRYTFVIDVDNSRITSFVDGEQVNVLNTAIPAFGSFKFYRNNRSVLFAYMDNFKAGYAFDAGAYASDYLTTDGGVKVTGDIPFDAATLGNAVLKDNSGKVISTEIYTLDGNNEFYVVPKEAVSADKTYTLDISNVKSVAGESYKNKIFTLNVMTEDIDTGFEDLSTGAWYTVPDGFSGAESGHMGEKWLADNDGIWSRVYYTQNVDYVAGNRALQKTFTKPLTSGKVVFSADYYSFEEGSTVRFDIVDSNDKAIVLAEFKADNKIVTRNNKFTTDGLQSTEVESGEYAQKVWQKVKAYIDLDKDLLTLYINGEKIAEQSTRFDTIKAIKFNPKSEWTEKHYALDNVEIKYAGVPASTEVKIVTPESDSVTVKFNNAISAASIDNAAILTSGGEELMVNNKVLSANGRELTLAVEHSFVLGDKYTVSLDGVYDMFGLEVAEDAVFTVVTKPVTTYSELSAVGTVVSSTVTNYEKISGNAYIIVAGYAGKHLKVVDFEPVSFTAEDATKELSFDYGERVDFAGCDSARAFLWRDFTSVKPIVGALDLEIE